MMTNRTSQSDHLQAVFLIDENTTRISQGNSREQASKCVSLCVLRILSYFKELRCPRFSSLHWGFKFYSSTSLTHRCERHNFKDFCVSEFENFEKILNSRFKKAQQQNSLCATSSSTTFAKSKSLTCALTDVIHDFQWDTSDINSPLRTTRRSNPAHSRKRHNVVFLLTSCPKSYQSLEEFVGRSVEPSEEFQSAVMSQALVREFVDIYGIKLYWIDTDYNNKAMVR